MMNKGLILEVQEKHWIVLTPDGDFVKVPRTNRRAEVGEEVFFQAERKAGGSRVWFPALSAVAAAMLGIFFVYPQFVSHPARAETYIYLDVNPSMAIGMNEERNVVEVKPLNDRAKEVIQETNWKNEEVEDFVVEVIETAEKKGYVHNKDRVVLSGFEENNCKSALKELERTVKKEIGKEHLNIDVHTLTIPAEAKNKAEKRGLTPAKYAAWLVAKKEGKELPVKVVEETSITKLAEELKPVSKLLEQPPSKTEWEEIIQSDPSGTEAPATNTAEPQPDQNGSSPATGSGTSGAPASTEPSGSQSTLSPDPGTPENSEPSSNEAESNDQPQQTEGSTETTSEPAPQP